MGIRTSNQSTGLFQRVVAVQCIILVLLSEVSGIRTTSFTGVSWPARVQAGSGVRRTVGYSSD